MFYSYWSSKYFDSSFFFKFGYAVYYNKNTAIIIIELNEPMCLITLKGQKFQS